MISSSSRRKGRAGLFGGKGNQTSAFAKEKEVKKLVALAVPPMIALCLVGCSGYGRSGVEDADSLFEQGSYEDALSQYLSIPEGKEGRDEMLAVAYERGVELFDNGEYGACNAYMESLVEALNPETELYHSAYDYIFPSMVLEKHYSEYETYNWLFAAYSLKLGASNGIESNEKALETGVFDPYVAFLAHEGLWRSVESVSDCLLSEGSDVARNDAYTYVFINGYQFDSANYPKETVFEIIGEDVSARSGETFFQVDVDYDEGCDKYIFDGRVSVSASGYDWIYIGFEVGFDDDCMYLENVKTSSSEYSIAEGRYSRDFAQSVVSG